ncbi:MAG TPA: pitrilysin family protein [Candidatus Paceibacterota bacterium]|jgi:predicted Zn-dependent peptidase|nr:pitrilysin family protein [Candidatus Paceibacterota bacterium]
MRYIKKTLKNGLRIISVPMPDAATVTILVLVEAGSKYETKRINGVAHFLEHMCFKGTAKRPAALDISRELDSIGAEYNAYTSQEYTGYYAKSAAKHYGKILDIVSDLYLNPTLDEREIEKEKGVVIEEINMYDDSPSDLVGELYEALLYGDQPAGWPILGTRESVQLLTREDISKYRAAHYEPQSTAVIVAGNFDEKKVFDDLEAAFGGMKPSAKAGKEKVRIDQSEPALLIKNKDSEQAHLALGVRTFSVYDKRALPLRLLNVVLSGGMSSRLWHRIRNEMGVAYYVYSSPSFRTDHGDLTVYAGVDNSRVPEVVAAIIEEFRRLLDEPVSDEELQKAKDYYAGQLALALESSDEFATFYGHQEIINREIQKPDDIIKELQAITADDLRKVANAVFDEANLNLALIGRVGDPETLKKLLKI